MRATALWTLILSLSIVSPVLAGPTDVEKCQAAKLNALRQRSSCLQGERRNAVVGKTPDLAKCEEGFVKAVAKADASAAKKKASCRWLDNADGTATDLNTGLQWELKTDDGSVHDKDNGYAWTTTTGGTMPDGSAFTVFLGTLNAGVSGGGDVTVGCFANHCDWRLPTTEELLSMLDDRYPNCIMNPCTTIPGFTASSFHLTSTTLAGVPTVAVVVNFINGGVSGVAKSGAIPVRAVRGGS